MTYAYLHNGSVRSLMGPQLVETLHLLTGLYLHNFEFCMLKVKIIAEIRSRISGAVKSSPFGVAASAATRVIDARVFLARQ